MLNPHYSYSDPSIFEEPKITEAFVACVEQFYYHDDGKQDQAANIELKKFQCREGAFDKKLARNFQNFDYNPGRDTCYYMAVCRFLTWLFAVFKTNRGHFLLFSIMVAVVWNYNTSFTAHGYKDLIFDIKLFWV